MAEIEVSGEESCRFREDSSKKIETYTLEPAPMSSTCLLSVIVPVYNTAPWLARCLDSICSQSYQNLEILCVDDGSTDNSAGILAEYSAKDSRIKVFTQVNAGLSAARNTALEHATGEWVTGVDSDDFLYPGVYEKAMAYCHSEVDMVFFGVQDVAEDGTPLPHNSYFDLPEIGEYRMIPELAAGLNVCFWSKLWRRSLIEENKLRFPVGLVHEDEAMYYLAAPYIRKIAICPAVGYAYMQRAGSIMKEAGLDAVKKVKRYVPVLEYVYAEYDHRNMLRTPAKHYLVEMFIRLCAGKYWQGIPEDREIVRRLCAEVIQKCGMIDADYRLGRFVPVLGWKRLFLTRHAQAKVYRFLGLPIWVSWYTKRGIPLSFRRACECIAEYSRRLIGPLKR